MFVGPKDILPLLPEGLADWETLLAKTGLSRPELLEILSQLRAEGFPILMEEEGAGLAPGSPAPQILFPLLKGEFGRAYRYLGVVTSTQDVLRAWEDAPIGAVVLAERQTRGRGRHGRVWESPPGNLYFSVLLGKNADRLLPLRAGLALREAARVGSLKWPNDLLAPDGRKLGGILVEAEGERIFLGVGINVDVPPLPHSAALREFREVQRAQLLADFLWTLEAWLEEKKEDVLAAWKDQNVTLGRKVVVRTGREILEGVALDLGEDGELIIRTHEGMRTICAGDVILCATDDVKDAKIGEDKAQGGGPGHGERERPGSSAE